MSTTIDRIIGALEAMTKRQYEELVAEVPGPTSQKFAVGEYWFVPFATAAERYDVLLDALINLKESRDLNGVPHGLLIYALDYLDQVEG